MQYAALKLYINTSGPINYPTLKLYCFNIPLTATVYAEHCIDIYADHCIDIYADHCIDIYADHCIDIYADHCI